MSSVILDLPLQECSSQRYILVFLYQIQIVMSQGSGVQAIDEEIKKYTTLSYRFLFFRSTDEIPFPFQIS